MIPPRLAAQVERNCLAIPGPRGPTSWAHVVDPISGANLGGHFEPDVATLARAVAPEGIEIVLVDGRLAMLTPNTRQVYQREVERGLREPVQRVEVDVLPKPAPAAMKTWTDTAPPTRPPTYRCSRCGAVPGLHQTLVAGAWSPTLEVLEKQLVVAGWRRNRAGRLVYCSLDCDTRAAFDAQAAAAGLPQLGGDQAALAAMRGTVSAQVTTTPAIPPVTVLPDLSWQRRAASVAAVLPPGHLENREIPDPEPAHVTRPVASAVAPPVAAPASAAPRPRRARHGQDRR